MPSSSIRINGSPTPVEDIAIGATVNLANFDDSGATTWAWTMLSKPNGSAAAIAAPGASATTFVADKEGSYLIRLIVNGTFTSTAVARIVATHTGFKILARDEVEEGDSSGVEGWARPSRDSALLLDKRLGLTNRRTVKYTGANTTGPKLLKITNSATLTNSDVVPAAELSTGNGYGGLVFFDKSVALNTNDIISVVESGFTDLITNPDSLSAEDRVYTSSTPGALTKTQSGSAIVIGYCAVVSGGNVRLWISPGAASLTGTGVAGGVVFWSTPATLSHDSTNLFWDDSLNRLGIGTITPHEKVDVTGGGLAVRGSTALTTGDEGIYLQYAGSTGFLMSVLKDTSFKNLEIDALDLIFSTGIGAVSERWRVVNSTGGTLSSSVASGSNAIKLLDGSRINFSTADSNAYISRSAADTLATTAKFDGTRFVSDYAGALVSAARANYEVKNNPAASSPGLAAFDNSLEIGGKASNAAGTNADIYLGAMQERTNGDIVAMVHKFGVAGERITHHFTYDGDTNIDGNLLIGGNKSDGRVTSTINSLYLISAGGPLIQWNKGAQDVVEWYTGVGGSLVAQLTAAGMFESMASTGTNAFKSVDGARWNLSTADASAYFHRSAANTIATPGSFTASGTLTAAGDTFQLSHSLGNIFFNNTAATAGAITSNISAANCGATAASAMVKIYPQQALDATDWVFSVGNEDNVTSLFNVDHSGRAFTISTFESGIASGSNAFKSLDGARWNLSTADGSAYLSRTAADTITAAAHLHATSTLKSVQFNPLTATSAIVRGAFADGASAIGAVLDNSVTLTNATAKIVSFQNNTVEKSYVDKDGYLYTGAVFGTDTNALLDLATGVANTSRLRYGSATVAVAVAGITNTVPAGASTIAGGVWSASTGAGGAGSGGTPGAPGGNATITTGAGGAGTGSAIAGTGGNIALTGGNAGADGGGGGAVGGTVSIESGASTGAAALSTINIGTTNAGTVTVGRAGQATALGGTPTVTDFLDDSATTGDRTVNKASGINAFATTTSTITITNDRVTTTSLVIPILQTDDTTALIKNCVPASGSFTINLTANTSGTTKVHWIVINH